MSTLILASASPRRADLLSQIRADFAIISADIDEQSYPDEEPLAYVERMALEKAEAIAMQHPDSVVLGSDTSVVLDRQILGKPSSIEHGKAMLQALQGRSHKVITSMAVCHQGRHKVVSAITEVTFCPLSGEQIEQYWLESDGLDKAGGYGIQGLAAKFISKINGSYSAVVGLALVETDLLLKEFNS